LWFSKRLAISLSFFEPKDHVFLGESLDVIDIERGAKVSGSRFYFLKGLGARLELALMQLALDQASEAGFTALITPTLVKPEIMQGTGFLGEHSAEVYYLPADDLYLTGTSEVALAGYHSGEILDDLTTPNALCRLVDLLSPGSRKSRKGHPGHSSGSPVQQA